jgi:hypothetical protein
MGDSMSDDLEIRFVASDPADQRKADLLTALYVAPLDSDEGFLWFLKACWLVLDGQNRMRKFLIYGDAEFPST